MRIESLTTKNFLGLAGLTLQFPQGLTLIAGSNGAGKSSVLEAIRFALLGEKIRGVRLKSDLINLVTQGAKDGSVGITVDGHTYRRSLKTGEFSSASPQNLPEVAPYVLDAQRFATLSPEDRRKFLFHLMQVETSHTAVGALLTKAEVQQDIVDEVLPMLRGGFEGAEKYAADQASQARGAWKAITGENYGSTKAENWEPKDESVTAQGESDDELAALAARVAEFEDVHAEALKALGAAEARARASNNPDLEKARSSLPTWKDKLVIGLRREGELVTEIAALELKAKETGGVYVPCPCCNELLLIDRGELKKAQAPAGDQMQASTDLAEARAELETTKSALQKLKNNIALAERMIGDADATTGDPVDLLTAVKDADSNMGRAKLARSSLEIRKREREQAGAKVKEALKHHRSAQAWKLCADQLSPNGIPATLLAQALYPINMQLGAASDLTEWGRVEIHADMAITYGGRGYALCSESERWRIDAMVADALARISGLKVLLLDRLDVLDMAGRAAAIQWLQSIAPEYETLIVGATLKALPNIEGVNTFWLDDATTGRRAA